MEKEELRELAREAVHARIREGVKAVIEQVLEEEMREHLGAGHRERTPLRRGWRNGHYTRELITPVGKLEQLRVPRDREGEFVTEVFERYKRMTGDVEEAVLEMYLQGVSVRRVAEITRALSRVKVGKDAVSRIARRLQEELALWRGRRLERAYPYLFLDATYLKVHCGERVREVALLVAVGVDEEGYREVLAVEEAGGERREVYRQLLRGLLDRGLRGVLLVVSDDHEAIKQAVASELPEARWQRCLAHFQRNVLAHVPISEAGEVAADFWAIFGVRREETARALAQAFQERYGRRYPRAVETLMRGLDDALTYLHFPGPHHRLIRTTNLLERLFRELKRRTRVVGVFPNQESALDLATAVILRASEDWALRRYMDMTPLKALYTKFAT
jgi:putative transposase